MKRISCFKTMKQFNKVRTDMGFVVNWNSDDGLLYFTFFSLISLYICTWNYNNN